MDDQQKRLNLIVNTLRPHLGNKDLQKCAQAIVLEAEYDAAFSTGCRVFVSREFLAGHQDEVIAFIVAHEFSHSLQNDGMNYIGYRLQHLGQHTPNPYIKSAELKADHHAAKIIRRAGYPPATAAHAIHALEFLNSPGANWDAQEGDHPSPRERLRAVEI
jgi:Zn-dependent protease with chaperone function